MDDADQHVVQVGQGAGRFARCPDALIRGRRGVLCQSVVSAAACHPLHDDEGVVRFQAGAEYLIAVRVVDLSGMSQDGATSREHIPRLYHGHHFLGELLQLSWIQSDFDFGSLHGGFSPVVERAQNNA